jgi:Fuc2NAc and GlcNAc transferase
MLDVPNDRSSHRLPTPRGGGLAIAGGMLAALIIAAMTGWVSRPVIAALGGGVIVTVAGWLDDRRGLSARSRALCYFAAAVWAVYSLGGLPVVRIGTWELQVGPFGSALAAIAIVWCINLYNFMDGIDGLAGAEAVCVALAAGILLLVRDHAELAFPTFLVAAASAGFLPWNWSPAKIFLGDAGSALLGFVFATLAVASENARALPGLLWVLLLGAFVADATVTLLRRILRGEPWYQPHKSHAYQRAVQAGLRHDRVTLIVIGVNGLLAIVAWATMVRPGLTGLAVLVAAVAVAALYFQVERVRPL